MAEPFEFCETCVFYNTPIAPDTYCAKRGLDTMHHMLGAFAGTDIFTIGGTETKTPTEKVEASFDVSLSEDVLACIESVRGSGDPLVMRDEF